MKKIIGYLLAALGLIGLLISSKKGVEITSKTIPFIKDIPYLYLLIPSLVLIALGIVILIVLGGGSSGKAKQSEKEVPIYQGEGKKRKIIGYRVEK